MTRRLGRWPGRRFAALPALVLAAVGCTTLAREEAEYTWNNGAEPETLDPAIMTGNPEHQLAIALFEGLTARDPADLHPLPGVAERWEISSDGRRYTFFLRSCQWSNGDAVTAQDFVYSWERVLRPETAAQYAYQLWYVRNGRAYSEARVKRVAPGGPPLPLMAEDWDPGGADCPAASAVRGACLPAASAGRSLPPGTPVWLPVGEAGAVTEHHGWVRAVAGQAPARSDDAPVPPSEAPVRGWLPAAGLTQDAGLLGLRALDERTFQVELENPTPFFLDLTSFFTLLPVHRRSIETWGDDWIKPGRMVSNGAFMLSEWRLNQWIELRRNPHYWDRDQVRLELARALPIDHTTTAFNVYETGGADRIDSNSMPLNLMDLLRARADFRRAPYLSVYFYRVNVERPPLDDPRIRRALALAIEREPLVEYILKAGELPANTFVPPGLPGYLAATDAALRFDQEQARALLAAAGYPEGAGFPRVEVLYNTLERHKDIAEVVQQHWKKNLGIDVTLVNQEWKVYLNSVHRQDYFIARGGWIGDYVDPNTFLDMWLTGGGNNNTGWSNAEYDRLIAEAGRTLDNSQRMEIFQRAERILLGHLPILPIYHYVSLNLVRPWVRGFHANVLDEHPLKHIWVDVAGRRAQP